MLCWGSTTVLSQTASVIVITCDRKLEVRNLLGELLDLFGHMVVQCRNRDAWRGLALVVRNVEFGRERE